MNEDTKCPSCNQQGHIIDSATVKSMLTISLRHVHDVAYRFCASSDCDVVYYSEHSQTFVKNNIRERVYQKEPGANDVLICYCFQHTTGDVQQHVTASTHATILEDINTGIQTGQCACDWRNPQGNCCLGNVRQYIKKLEEAHDTP